MSKSTIINRKTQIFFYLFSEKVKIPTLKLLMVASEGILLFLFDYDS